MEWEVILEGSREIRDESFFNLFSMVELLRLRHFWSIFVLDEYEEVI